MRRLLIVLSVCCAFLRPDPLAKAQPAYKVYSGILCPPASVVNLPAACRGVSLDPTEPIFIYIDEGIRKVAKVGNQCSCGIENSYGRNVGLHGNPGAGTFHIIRIVADHGPAKRRHKKHKSKK